MFLVDTHFICQIKEINLSCWGCCGRDFKNQKEIEKDILENTIVFNKINFPMCFNLLNFRDRFSKNSFDLKKSGICSNLVYFKKENIFACPLHKNINKLIGKNVVFNKNKKDLRYGHCDVNYKCITVKIFENFSKKEKKDYILWIKKQNFNHYKYSIGNVNGTIIKKYLNILEKKNNKNNKNNKKL